MATSKADLVAKLTELTNSHWADEKEEALLLSVLGPLLTEWDADYKSALSGKSLRIFIKNEVPDLAIAQHSSKYAKVGVYPANKTFSYDSGAIQEKTQPTEADKLKKSRRAFYTFIEAISLFPDEDIKNVHIPTSVIIRLLEGK